MKEILRKLIDNIVFVKKLIGYVDVSRHVIPNSLIPDIAFEKSVGLTNKNPLIMDLES